MLAHRPIILSCPGVYPPSEDSELLSDTIEVSPGERVLDMGSGTGILGIRCALQGGIVTAADTSGKALECTSKNAELNGLMVRTIQTDLFENISGEFDVILFNPPYLPEERWSRGNSKDKQWDGGGDGSGTIRAFLQQLPRHLRGRCYLLFSSLTGGGKEIMESIMKRDFVFRQLAEKNLFFETLYVYELRPCSVRDE